jgi:hypothetical protein
LYTYTEPRDFTSLLTNRVNETSGKTFQLKIASETADFFTRAMAFLVYGGSSSVRTLNYTSFHMLWVVRIKVDMLALVFRFSVESGGQCRLFTYHKIQENGRTVWLFP